MEEILNEEGLLSEKLKSTIATKVAELKEANPKVRKIYPIFVQGTEGDDKPFYVAYFRQPSFMAFSQYLTYMQKDQVASLRNLARDCFMDGDKELVDDDSLFLFGLMGQFAQIIEMRNGALVNLSKPGK